MKNAAYVENLEPRKEPMGYQSRQKFQRLRIASDITERDAAADVSTNGISTEPALEQRSLFTKINVFRLSPFSIIVAFLIMTLTMLTITVLLKHNQKANRDHFNLLKTKLENEIVRRVGVYRYGLMGTRSTFMASDKVERKEFENLVSSRDLPEEFPAATGLGFIEHVTIKNLEPFLEKVRADNQPQFKIRRLKKAMNEPDYMIIKYIEPANVNHQAIGLDIGSERNRRQAATLAMRSGNVAITRFITLVQAQSEGAGFLILLPVYNSSHTPTTPYLRQKYIVGWVYMTILAERLFNGISPLVEEQLNFSVYDDQSLDKSQLLYNGFGDQKHQATHNPEDDFSDTVPVLIGGRNWYVHTKASKQFQSVSNGSVLWVGVGGLILTVLTTLLIQSQTTATSRANQMAAAMTIDLKNSMTKLNDAMQSAEEARQIAEHANQSKSEFLATMSHEIRTPLNGVLGMASILSQSELTQDQRNQVNTISSSGESLLTIINDILDFSKIEAGKLNIENIAYEPREIVSEVMDLIQVMAYKKNIELNCIIDPRIPNELMGDPIRMRQIILNLMNNAIKFTDKGSVTLHIQHKQETDKKIIIQYAIKDTGVGIPSDIQKKLFNKFSQADSSTTRKHGGTGLGLAISKRLVEMMNGQIGVISQPGEGATFWFTIASDLIVENAVKQKNIDTIQTDKPSIENNIPQNASELFGQANILVVDDNQVNRVVAKQMLQMLGANVILATSADEAFEVTKLIQFHLVLMDIQMPEVDGYAATKMLRGVCHKHATPPDVPIVALTANAMQQDRNLCINAGMNDYIAKPVRLETLHKTLQKWIPPSQQHAA